MKSQIRVIIITSPDALLFHSSISLVLAATGWTQKIGDPKKEKYTPMPWMSLFLLENSSYKKMIISSHESL